MPPAGPRELGPLEWQKTRLGGFETKNAVRVGSSELTMSFEGIAACIETGAGAIVAKSVNESPAAKDQLAIADYFYLEGRACP
jgi:hypothetical protein